MAIGKSVSGKGFKGAASYILDKKDAQFLYARGVVTEDPILISKQMRAVADMRNVKNTVAHFSISLNKDERVSDEQWQKAADAFLKKMGFDLDQTQYVVARHRDTEYDHIHILANRVQLNNVFVNDFQHKKLAHEATREAELADGFRVFESKKEREILKSDVRQKIDRVLNQRKSCDLNTFKNDLQKVGVTVIENRSQSTGKLHGLSFKTDENHSYKASSLGKAYSLSGLEKRGLDAGRDQQKRQQHNSQKHAQHSPRTEQVGASTQARVDAKRARDDAYQNKVKASDRERESNAKANERLHQEDEYELEL